MLIVFVAYTASNTNFNNFIQSVENKTFDLRQNMIVNSGYKQHNNDIVIIAIDDATYEYVLDKYGEWPLKRDIYAKIVDKIEAQNPKAIAFDLMFVKSLKSNNNSDNALVNSFGRYKNLYTAMNFDNQSEDLRTPPEISDKLSVNVENQSKNIDFADLTFSNCRNILQGIIDATSNIGIINVSRSDDGVLRKMPVFVKYKDKFYPQLAFKIGMDILGINSNEFVIDKNSNININGTKIYLDSDGSAILNWYGASGTFEHIPAYKLIKSVNGDGNFEYDFSGKIVYFGSTAASLFDIKTTPISKIYPGVEIQTTYLNNILDNNFIKKADKKISFVISMLMAAITGLLVISSISTPVLILISVSMYSLYIALAYFLMKYCSIWTDIVYPLTLGLFVFVTAFIVKYIIKSRDFDKQYVLATTDGLTNLYNHRYFQEQMKMYVDNSSRYGTTFSLIIIDIDFFKKFNDTFGHQAGDEVLRQVASVLKQSVRSSDIVCRYGGEEMSIILPNTSKEISHSTAEKICKRVSEKKFKLNNSQESHVTISLGVSTYPDDGNTAAEIIETADKRLYQSKNNGRNQVN